MENGNFRLSARFLGYHPITSCSVVQSFSLCDPLVCSPPGSSVDGIFQARMLEWVAISDSRCSSWPRDRTYILCLLQLAGGFFSEKVIHFITLTPNFACKNSTLKNHQVFGSFEHDLPLLLDSSSAPNFQFTSAQSLICAWLFANPWTVAPTPGVYANSCPLSQWSHPTISSSVISCSCLQFSLALGSLQMNQFFESGGQSIGVSASTSVLLMNI